MLIRNTIGNRLITAIAFMSFLTISVSMIAVINWDTLDTQIKAIVDKNLPALWTSYRLERNTAGLQAALNALSNNRDPVQHGPLKQTITDKLDLISTAIHDTADLKHYQAIKAEHQTLVADIAVYADLLYQRNAHRFAVTQTENTLKWLHKDLVDELAPLRQEVEWQLTSVVPNALSPEAIKDVTTEFSYIQSITIKENELYLLVQEVIQQRHLLDLGKAFYYVGNKIKEINEIGQNLNHYTASTSYRELLKEMILLVAPAGVLETQLRQDIELHNTIARYQDQIQTRLANQEILIQQMVEQENRELHQRNEQAHRTITISNLILFGTMLLSICLSVILSIYLVGRGIVKRLNLLSQDLYAVANGQLDTQVQVSGDDEIGMLGDNLRLFCSQMQEMQQSNALNLINNTQASIITCNLLGLVESVNPSAQLLFRYRSTPDQQTLWSLFSDSMQQRLQALFAIGSPLLNNGACSLTLKHEHHSGKTHYLRLDFRLFSQGSSDKVIITMTDISEQENAARWLENMVRDKTQSLINRNRQLNAEIEDRKRIEADLRATQDELIQAAKMAVVGQTMTSLAHELNQPLSAISTHVFATRVALEKGRSDQLPASLDKIDNLTSRMGRIIASLRNFAKKQSANSPLAPVNLQEALQQATLIVESRAKVQKTTIVSELDPQLMVLADQVQFEQVLVNLLVNSCDAVAAESKRTITVFALPGDGQRLRLAVSDSGHGFSAEIIEQLFVPFTTTKDVGLGLGLSICRSILSRLEGDIYLASNLQGGALVVLELNCYDNK
ncbi:ATP-binding protein [Photobacterium sp. TY1-4]|uniref:ATP-binding protein n=1 Tax=Photobacterium sp. TY1-4 TaxID=2899122 RepID=UPI0021BE90C3|nr:ATP-binding protein [Photobacterium sp. TY1-4]UXI01965.1 ATP-binding protein [Photobacterium sp. TY1-4]